MRYSTSWISTDWLESFRSGSNAWFASGLARRERNCWPTGIALAANARLAQARASLYPQLRLTGSGGTATNELQSLLDGDFSEAHDLADLFRACRRVERERIRVSHVAREAEDLARQMQSGRMPPDARARQERLFHRMLDAGRTLEKDEIEDERSAERPPMLDARAVDALDPNLFRDPTRFRAPTAEELQALPPAYRRLILDYFEKLNRSSTPQQERPSSR